jgi:hypothetical protein
MKMPAQVIKKVTRIQREFLWGGVKGGKKLCWIKTSQEPAKVLRCKWQILGNSKPAMTKYHFY